VVSGRLVGYTLAHSVEDETGSVAKGRWETLFFGLTSKPHIDSMMFVTLRVDTPLRYISAMALASARSERNPFIRQDG
jgi:hypothetical protein